MKASKRRVRNSEHKGAIREKYRGIDPSEIEVIPANEDSNLDIENRKMKVGAYVRVSTQNDEQTSSFELQVNDFTKRINDNPNWEFAGIYSDEGISGTELSHRTGIAVMCWHIRRTHRTSKRISQSKMKASCRNTESVTIMRRLSAVKSIMPHSLSVHLRITREKSTHCP